MFPRAARVRFCAVKGRAAAHEARPAQARGDLEHRGRPQADRRTARTRRSTARRHDRAHAGIFRQIRSVAGARHHRAAVPGREPLCRRMRRQEIRQLRRMARHRLCDHAGVLPGTVAAVRVYRFRPAGRAAGGRAAARRGAVAGGGQGAGGYSGRARHDPDRSAGAQIGRGRRTRHLLARRSPVQYREPARPVLVTCCYAWRTDPGERDPESPSRRPIMTDQAITSADDHLDLQDVQRRVKAIFIGSIGNLVEWYDFYAYTAFALYFAPAFFPNSDPVVQQLNAAVLFAATFLMRPLGGWLFGFIADRYGRRLSLTLSVVCMCFGSLIIAVTPTYATIGIAAPAILALARIIEGLSLGGEYGASATYLSEVADPRHRGFYSSFQYVTLIGGQLTAITVLLLLQNVFLTTEELKAWGWRIPFVIGALLAIVAAVMRRNLHETEAFEEAKKVSKPSGSIRGLLNYPRELLLVVGLTAGGTAAFYTFTTYMQTFVKLSVGLTEDQTTLKETKSPFMAFLLICAAWIFVAGYTSINAIVKAELFPTKVRALGVGLPYAITVSLFGGTAPAVALYFKSFGHEDWFYYYLSAMIFLSLLIYSTMRDTKHASAMLRHQ